MLERYEREGLEGILELLAEDGVFVVPPEASTEPDTYVGHAGARRYFAGFDGAIDEVAFVTDALEDVAPGLVLGLLRLRGVGAVSGVPVEQKTLMTFRVRDGLVDRIVAHGDMDSARDEIERSVA